MQKMGNIHLSMWQNNEGIQMKQSRGLLLSAVLLMLAPAVMADDEL